MRQTIIIYNLLVPVLMIGGLILLWRVKSQHFAATFFAVGLALGVLVFLGAFFSPVDVFGKIQLLAWAVFLHAPLFLAGVAGISYRREDPLFYISGVLAVCLVLVAIDAFLIEPHWLEVSQVTIPSSKLQNPLRVAVIADLQTDKLGRYEQRVFELVAAGQPDLILLAGDYLHIWDPAEYLTAKAELNALMRRTQLEAPLGIYAVEGNIERPDWPELFDGLSAGTFETTSSQDLGPLILTGLTLDDSWDTALSLHPRDKFHIVFGHAPDYSLGQVEADLLIAGHTHGGQIRIPFVGPVITFSQVPKAWASGVNLIAPGKHLIVSRGVGLERGNAPRMRFLCRPELLFIDLVPSE